MVIDNDQSTTQSLSMFVRMVHPHTDSSRLAMTECLLTTGMRSYTIDIRCSHHQQQKDLAPRSLLRPLSLRTPDPASADESATPSSSLLSLESFLLVTPIQINSNQTASPPWKRRSSPISSFISVVLCWLPTSIFASTRRSPKQHNNWKGNHLLINTTCCLLNMTRGWARSVDAVHSSLS